jgi:hypothetical protein
MAKNDGDFGFLTEGYQPGQKFPYLKGDTSGAWNADEKQPAPNPPSGGSGATKPSANGSSTKG